MVSSVLPLALAASLASTVAIAGSVGGHAHVARAHHSHRSFFPVRPALQARDKLAQPARMMKKVRRSAAASSYSTTAIWYAETGWVGACGETLSEDEFVVGLPLALYPSVNEKSALCGEQVTAINTATGANITATVVDASNRDDYTIFSSSAFTALGGDLDAGELAITFSFVNSAVDVPSSASLASATSGSASHETPSAGGAASTAGDKKSTTSSAAPQTTSQAAAQVKVAAVKTSSAAPTTTTTSAPVATSSAASSDDGEECEEGDDDCVCDDESSSSSAPAQTSAAQTTTSSAPKQTTTTQAAWSSSSSSKAAASTTSSAAYTSSSKVADTSSASVLAASGIQGFLGDNTDAILSWYNTNSGTDSTNGNSWCGFPYDNNVPGFAPSLKTMLNNFGGDYETAAKAYCGLEAEVSTPDGKTVTLYIADAFDDTWVITPSSLDIIHGSFESLYGSYTDNKNDVVKNASWKFTGKRNTKYAFKSTTSLS